jgi:hypothetical protein
MRSERPPGVDSPYEPATIDSNVPAIIDPKERATSPVLLD